MTGLLFVLTGFCVPIVKMVGGGCPIPNAEYYAAFAASGFTVGGYGGSRVRSDAIPASNVTAPAMTVTRNAKANRLDSGTLIDRHDDVRESGMIERRKDAVTAWRI